MDQTTLLTIVGIILGVSAIAGCYVAIEKGRGIFEGFLMGALLGPFGVLTVASLPTIDKPWMANRK